jgi:hypothetical protein
MPTLMRRLAQSSCIPALREGGELRQKAATQTAASTSVENISRALPVFASRASRPAEDTLASQRQVGTIRAAVWEFN